MKKLVFILISTLMFGYSCLNPDKYKETDLFEEFETSDGFTILHLPPVLIKIILSSSKDSISESNDVFDKVDVIKVMYFEENENSMKKDELKDKMNAKIEESKYKLLSKISQENNDISIYIIERENMIKEALVTILSEKEYIGLDIVGNFTKEEIFKVYKSINMDKLKSMDN